MCFCGLFLTLRKDDTKMHLISNPAKVIKLKVEPPKVEKFGTKKKASNNYRGVLISGATKLMFSFPDFRASTFNLRIPL